jgi:3-dehydroquinate synthase
VVKHALVADQSQWEKLVRHTSLQGIDWPGVIEHSVRIKTAIVESDPTERGARKALNFGHTIGHALESWSLDTRQPLRHGEAVAAGMICETFLSEKISGLPANEADSIRRHLGSLFGKISFTPADYPAIFEFLRQDKKNRSGQTRLTLLQAIGSFLIDQPVPDELILESLEIYRKVGWQ